MITSGVLDTWPDVSRRVVARLRALGIGGADAEDLASEAITRAVAKGVTFDSVDHLYAWTLHVARNIHVDQRRAVGRGPAMYALDDLDLVATADTADVVEHRLRLEDALRVLATFSDADRAAVMEQDLEPEGRQDAVRLAVRRHRARSRLRAAIAGLAALLGWRGLLRPRRVVAVAFAPVAVVGVLVLTPGEPAGPGAAPFGEALNPPSTVVDPREGVPVRVAPPRATPRPAPPVTEAVTGGVSQLVVRDDPLPSPGPSDVVTVRPHRHIRARVRTVPRDSDSQTFCFGGLEQIPDEICLGKKTL